MTPQPEQTDLRSYLRTLWRWKLLFLALLIATPVVSYLLEARKIEQYQSSTLMQVNSTLDPGLFGGSAPPTASLPAIARLVKTRPLAVGAAKFLKPPPAEPTSLLGQIEAQPDTETGFLTLTATDPNPRRAADIANAFAAALSDNRAQVAIERLDLTIANVQKQISRLSPDDGIGRSQLSDQLQQLRAARASQDANEAVIERAEPSGVPIGRNTGRAIQFGLVIGLLLGLGAVVLAENADRRVRTPEDLESLTGLPLLSAIPASAFSTRGGGDPRDDESFKRLRGALTYFNVDRRLASVLITSPGQQDGKTVVAVRLAVATARAGKCVVLVEADLRRPQVAQRLGLDEHAQGLASVLAGERRVDDVLIDYPLGDALHADATPGGRLLVLPGGPVPPNPSELIASDKMQRVVATLENQADLVLIDTPALLAVSDALPLLPHASGVVIVARVGQTTKAAVRRLLQIIVTASGTALGVVATGTREREGYEGYSYGYYDHGSGQNRRTRRRARRESGNAEVPPPDIPRAEDSVATHSPSASRSA